MYDLRITQNNIDCHSVISFLPVCLVNVTSLMALVYQYFLTLPSSLRHAGSWEKKYEKTSVVKATLRNFEVVNSTKLQPCDSLLLSNCFLSLICFLTFS